MARRRHRDRPAPASAKPPPIVEAMTRAHGRHLGLVERRAVEPHGRRRCSPAIRSPSSGARGSTSISAPIAIEPLTLRAGALLPSATGAGRARLSRRAAAPAARARSAREPVRRARRHRRPSRRPHAGARAAGAASRRRSSARAVSRSISETCASSGAREDLIYVSPKSGRAVSASAGAPWRDRLLPLPAFLKGQGERGSPGPEDIAAAFRLTGHFLLRDLFAPRGLDLPDSRRAFLAAAGRAAD